jgi:hypothetical protein
MTKKTTGTDSGLLLWHKVIYKERFQLIFERDIGVNLREREREAIWSEEIANGEWRP